MSKTNRNVEAASGTGNPRRTRDVATRRVDGLDPGPLSAAQQSLHELLLADEAPPGGQLRSLVVAVSQEPVNGWCSHLLKRHAVWCGGAGGQLDRRFVNLTLLLDRKPGVEGERFVPDVRQREQGRYDDLADLLDSQPDAGAWLLTGDPGCGKSTLLQHHELASTLDGLKALASGGVPRELCFWVRLSDYAHDDASPDEWLAQRWATLAGSRLPGWAEARRLMRIRLLADGLNEIKAPDAAAQGQAMLRWARWAATLQHSGGGHLPPVFSVRTLEIGDGLQGAGLALRHVGIGRWTDDQLAQYCEARGARAVWALLNDGHHADLLDLCRLPFNAAAQCELHQASGQVAVDRAGILSGVVWHRIIHELGKGESGALAAPGLLSARDREPIGNGRWMQSMYALPEQGSLVRGLDAQAERLHREGKQTSFREAALLAGYETLKTATAFAPATPQSWLKGVKALDFIGESSLDAYTGEALLRYTHQLWQEFFAGRSLRDRASAGNRAPLGVGARAAVPDLSVPALEPLATVLANLGTEDSLPPPAVSLWEEPVKLAAQLSRQPADWIAELMRCNLPLAGRAAAACRRRLEVDARGAPMLDKLRQALLERSRDLATDLRLRIEAADALGLLGDPRYAEATGPRGERFLTPRAAGWVLIDTSHAKVGSDRGADDEQPQVEVPMEPFEVAFAPLTNAEFRHFIEAGGYDDDRWWSNEMARRWRREGLRNETEIAWRRSLFDDARRNLAETIARFPDQSARQREMLRQLSEMSEADHEAQLESFYGARIHRRPDEWANPRFNQPLQPVVGLCIHEAQAYCAWLSARCGQQVRLPTEAEWEVAARYASAAAWPWGDEAPQAAQINDASARLGRTNPIGTFPGGESALGLTDLSGNVWEWTVSAYTERFDRRALTEPATPDCPRLVVRGGSWLNEAKYCRLGCRRKNTPLFRGSNLGLRLVRAARG